MVGHAPLRNKHKEIQSHIGIQESGKGNCLSSQITSVVHHRRIADGPARYALQTDYVIQEDSKGSLA